MAYTRVLRKTLLDPLIIRHRYGLMVQIQPKLASPILVVTNHFVVPFFVDVEIDFNQCLHTRFFSPDSTEVQNIYTF